MTPAQLNMLIDVELSARNNNQQKPLETSTEGTYADALMLSGMRLAG